MGLTMGRWMRRGVAVGMLLLTAAMLSACVEVNQQSTIGTDFKGTTNMRVGFSKEALQLITSIGGDPNSTPTPNSAPPPDPFADVLKQVTGMGGTATPYSTDKFQGLDITLNFSSLDEMQNQINAILGSSSGGPSGPPGGGGPGGIAQITAKSTGNGVRIDGQVDPLSDLSNPPPAGGAAPNAPPIDVTALLASGGQIQLAFTMPGKIVSADPLAMQNGSTVSWTFKVGDPKATIFAESNNG